MRPLLLAAVLLLFAAPARAVEFTVTTGADDADQTTADEVCKAASGECTLRAALEQANALAGPDDVTVPKGTYVLTVAAPLTITSAVTVTGPGAVVDAGGDSGALYLAGSAATVTGLTFTGAGTAPAVIASNGDDVLDGVTIRGNTYTGVGNVFGGGLLVNGTSILRLTGSAITGNRLNGEDGALGAGVYVSKDASLIAVRTTIADNHAVASDPGSQSFGGGVLNAGSTALRHVTLAGNSIAAGSAAGGGGNLWTGNAAQPIALEDSIVTGGLTYGFAGNCGGPAVVPSGRNLDSDGTCGLPAPNLSGVDPVLDGLGAHGGGTPSLPPLLGSPVVDAAAGCGAGTTDQRGNPAPSGAACDIGAAELGADRRVTLVATGDGDPTTFVAKVANDGLDPTAVTVGFELGAAPVLVEPSRGTCAGTQCDLGTLAAGETASVTVVAPVTTATARVSGPVPDPVAGNDTASASVTAQSPPPPPGADTTAPVLSGVKVKGRLRARARGTVAFTLSEAATVRVKVRRRGRTRSITATARAGKGKLRIPRRLVRRGRLRLTVIATDAAGNTSKPVVLRVRARK